MKKTEILETILNDKQIVGYYLLKLIVVILSFIAVTYFSYFNIISNIIICSLLGCLIAIFFWIIIDYIYIQTVVFNDKYQYLFLYFIEETYKNMSSGLPVINAINESRDTVAIFDKKIANFINYLINKKNLNQKVTKNDIFFVKGNNLQSALLHLFDEPYDVHNAQTIGDHADVVFEEIIDKYHKMVSVIPVFLQVMTSVINLAGFYIIAGLSFIYGMQYIFAQLATQAAV